MPLQKTSRKEILLKSVQLFRQRGYHNTSMSQVAEHCGVFKSHFYHYFKSKSHLMEEAIELVATYFEEKLFAIAFDKKLTPRERGELIVEKMKKFFTDGQRGCFFAKTILETNATDPDFKPRIRDVFTAFERAFVALFSNHGEATAKKKSRAHLCRIEGAMILMQVHDDVKILEEAFDDLLLDLSNEP